MRGLAMPALGIIPAHAGLTAYSISFAHCARDHSRVCGAHSQKFITSDNAWGSSPRMRGSQNDARPAAQHRGIIPAYAGLTSSSARRRARTRDHPRACGAHSHVPANGRACGGSSPRMRGSHAPAAGSVPSVGIIPAHAGLTGGHRPSDIVIWDHPRACGAHADLYRVARLGQGSSPRMRGSLDR